jgi:hypothetical protein
MIRIVNETQLKEFFRNLDQDEVSTIGLKFPMGLKDYTSWLEPSGHRVYLVFRDTESQKPRGIVFTRTHSHTDGISKMCDWCHSVRGGDSIGLLSARASQNLTIGVELCTDLSCKEKLAHTPGVNDVRETLSPDEKIERLLKKMSDFARHHLF